jgi:hypothetical protein
MPGPLIDWSDDELKTGIRNSAEHVTYYYVDFLRELERRGAERQARDSRILSLVSLAIAVAALVVTALKS